MSKYNGIKKVEPTVKTSIEVKNVEEKAEANITSGLFARWILSALILFSLFALKTISSPITEKIVSSVKSAIMLDYADKLKIEQTAGQIKVVDLLKEVIGQKANEE